MLPAKFRPPPVAELLQLEPYGRPFAAKLRGIHSALPERIGSADRLGPAVMDAVIESALGLACQAQNDANIRLGRALLLELPRASTAGSIERVARSTLDLTDDWEVRRLLEVVALLELPLLHELAREFAASSNEDIRDAAEEVLELATAG